MNAERDNNMVKTNLSSFTNDMLNTAYQEIIEHDLTGILPYGLVKKAHEDEKTIYPEIAIDKIKYYFLKEIATRWVGKINKNEIL